MLLLLLNDWAHLDIVFNCLLFLLCVIYDYTRYASDLPRFWHRLCASDLRIGLATLRLWHRLHASGFHIALRVSLFLNVQNKCVCETVFFKQWFKQMFRTCGEHRICVRVVVDSEQAGIPGRVLRTYNAFQENLGVRNSVAGGRLAPMFCLSALALRIGSDTLRLTYRL